MKLIPTKKDQLMQRNDSEHDIEEHLRKACRSLDVLCYKFISPGRAGVPDRILIGHRPDNTALQLFLELKRPGATPRPTQVARITQMQTHGAHVEVADSTDAVDALLHHYFCTTKPTTPVEATAYTTRATTTTTVTASDPSVL